MPYIVTNFAYGFGPFLRTTELALAVNAQRKERGQEELGILVPWVYGEKQKKIMLEEFADHADSIFLDEMLGTILKQVFYADSTYEAALAVWVADYERVSMEAKTHLSTSFAVESLSGKPSTIEGKDIALELARAPRISYGVAPVYGATFGNISDILKATVEVSTSFISADRELIKQAIPISEALEASQTMVGAAEPGTFSYVPERIPLLNEVAIPPTIRAPHGYEGDSLTPGIFVTITGIPGLERLYKEAEALGLTVYSNDPERMPGSVKASPDCIASDAIELHFARSGWGSIWGSMLLGKAIIVPEFDPADDPEIFFNNECVERLGLGIVYRGQPLPELIKAAKALQPGIQARNQELRTRFGTLDGNEYMARLIVDHLPS
ncbi:MAG: hypothetical protein JWL82_453 [Parcubacteria group bacterium]|nr:hypothetical protein [Parcubacteria group bacterium]